MQYCGDNFNLIYQMGEEKYATFYRFLYHNTNGCLW